jgi:hypothetical protein
MKYDWSIPTSDIDIINSDYNRYYKLTEEQLLKIVKDLVNKILENRISLSQSIW